MGKSRLLDILVAPNGVNDSGRTVKEQGIKEFVGGYHEQDEELLEFYNRISKAVGLCASFNGDSGRRRDLGLIPKAMEALSMRFLWGYFCSTVETSWSSFVGDCAGFLVESISLEKVVDLILQDIGQDLDLIMCIDELVLAEDGCPYENITDAARDILSGLAPVLDHNPRVHIVLSSLLYSSLNNYLSLSQKAVMCVNLPAISPDHYVKLAHDTISAWLEDTTELSGNMGGKVKDVVWQGLLDSGGHPRLLENVVEYFKKKAKKKGLASATLGDLHETLCNYSVAKACEASLPTKLLGALKYMCSGKVYRISDLDPYISCGLLLQSANQAQASHALMPPLLIGMLYVHERMNNSTDLSSKILEACHHFMSLDTLASRAATAGDFFEKLIAHLLRLRLLLLAADHLKTFGLKDLLTVDGANNQERWWNKKGTLKFEMPKEAVFPVSTISAKQMRSAVQSGCPDGGAIYIAESDQNEAFDILIHLPGSNPCIAIQSRFSKPTTKSSITNTQVKKCLVDFCRYHQFLASKASAFVVLAFREAGAQLSAQDFAGSDVEMSKACRQVAVLDKEDVMKLIPVSLQGRPQLSSSSVFSNSR
jgi:hypothetical protein